MKLRTVLLVLLAWTAAIPANASSIGIDSSRPTALYDRGVCVSLEIRSPETPRTWMGSSPALGNTFAAKGSLTNRNTFSLNAAGNTDSKNLPHTLHLNILTRENPDGSLHRNAGLRAGYTPLTVPEPGTLSLLGTGLLGVGRLVRRKGKSEKAKHDTERPVHLHPDGLHCVARICLQGHVQSSDGCFETADNCAKCGATCIDECQNCRAPLKGQLADSPLQSYELPFLCHASECGLPYPWMQDEWDTAQELLYDNHDLSLAERDELWELMKFVMSDPKSDLAAAKTGLIATKLAKVNKTSREFLLDFIVKTAAEAPESEG